MKTRPSADQDVQSIDSARSANRFYVGVIGGGKISEQHLMPLTSRDDVDIVGICDLSAALARFEAERFGVDAWFTDYREMLQAQRPNIVHVLTPPATHQAIVRDCLEHGAHVIVEKPIALCNRDFRELWDVASDRGLHLIENHNYRFNAPIRTLDRLVMEGRLGRIEEVEVRMALNIRGGGRYADENLPHPSHRLPAGVLHEFVSHLGYLLLHFMPDHAVDRLETVRALWLNHGGGELFKYDDLDATIIADSVHGRIRFTSRHWPDVFSVSLKGSDGCASAELFQPGVQWVPRRPVGQHLTPLVNSIAGAGRLVSSGFGSVWGKIRNRSAYEGLHRFIGETYDAISTGGSLPVSYEQMDETSRLIDALLDQEHRV